MVQPTESIVRYDDLSAVPTAGLGITQTNLTQKFPEQLPLF
ncbi:hypothetical protein SPLC1_S590670 [Arthrospira platensis C1]|nr:hypothetical protein SPLC1_S590670 [Arthrospira platensis C1]